MPTLQKQRTAAGAILTLVGVAILLLSADVIPLNESSLHAPRWVLAAVGLIAFFAGLSLLGREGGPGSLLAVALAVSCMAAVFTWVAGWADSAGFQGGIWFLPRRFNQVLGRIFFMVGAALLWLIAWLVWRSFARARRS